LYVSSAEDAAQDQVLEEVMVGPVPVGVNKFVLQVRPHHATGPANASRPPHEYYPCSSTHARTQAEAPDVSKIPEEDIVGVTVILITCSYREQEFVRVGYYVNNEYGQDVDPENPPRPIDLSKLVRSILADKPRVTRFPIQWTGDMVMEQGGEAGGAAGAEEGEEYMGQEGAAGYGDKEEDDDDEEEDDGDEEGEIDLEDLPAGQADGMDIASPVKGVDRGGAGAGAGASSMMTSPLGMS
jgi:histone chaperone ASF1